MGYKLLIVKVIVDLCHQGISGSTCTGTLCLNCCCLQEQCAHFKNYVCLFAIISSNVYEIGSAYVSRGKDVTWSDQVTSSSI